LKVLITVHDFKEILKIFENIAKILEGYGPDARYITNPQILFETTD
jgi:hypothetical protein